MQFRVRNGCDRTVYLTDNYNHYRVLNLDALPEPFSCNQIKYSKDYLTPSIDLKSVDNGGSLKVGTYQFAIRYLDKSYNATNWILISNSVPINEDSMTATYGLYDGGINKVDNNTLIGEVTGNKKITLSISDLDTNFVYYEIAILSYTSNTGTLTSVLKSNPISISQTSFTYTGNESFDSIDITDVLVDDVLIEKVATHAQLDNRLYLGNVSNFSVDYSNYQKYASKITTEWISDFSTNYDSQDNKFASAFTNPKNEFYYYNNVGFHPDEIYAVGVVFVHTNGAKSPVFHIPGRCPIAADEAEVIGGKTNENVFNPSKTKTWQVFNTASVTALDGLGKPVRGKFGYYETSTTYPVVNTCDNPEDYWGVSCDGTKLTGKKIRHHRFPSWNIVTPETLTGCKGGDPILGIKFSNITYPSSDIVGHYFVFGDRANDYTIYDSAYLHRAPVKESNGIYDELRYDKESFDSPVASTSNNHNLLSTKTWFDNEVSKADYFTAVKVFNQGYTDDDSFTAHDVRSPSIEIEIQVDEGTIWNFADQCNSPKITKPTSYNYIIKDVTTIAPMIDYGTPERFPIDTLWASNGSTVNYASFLKTDRHIPYNAYNIDKQSDVFVYGYLKYDRDVFEDLFSIQYINNNNSISNNILYAGDTFNTSLNLVEPKWAASTNPDYNVSYKVISMFLSFQLKDNYAFRHGDKLKYQYSYFKYEPLLSVQANGIKLAKYLAGKVYYNVTSDYADATPYIYDEYYLYNPDYSVASSPERYTSLPGKFDFCNKCQEVHPYRIYYSQLDNQEGLEDNYLKVLPLSYRDLDGSQGSITGLVNNFNNLYAVTTHTVYFIPTRPQQLGTNENTIYIGTGEVLSTPPRQLKVTNFEYGGTNFQSSITNTEYGTFYVDDMSGTPFMLTNELTSIADGLRNEWRNNGGVHLIKFLKSLGHEYTHLTTMNGVGYTTTYDPRHKRLIVHKKDYVPIVSFTKGQQSGILDFYRGEIINAATKQKVELTDPKLFKDVSYTISYSFLTNSWTSYHSYMPKYLFNNYETFFSSSGKYILKYNSGPYQTYDSIKYDHVIEATLVSSPFTAKTFESVMYESETYLNDLYTELSFDRFIAYNDKQSTGLQLLNVSNLFGTNNSNIQSLLRRKDKYWRINHIRDFSINSQPAIIDNIPNAAKVNINKSLFTLERMRDYYLSIRFYFKPNSNQKITTDLFSVTSKPTDL